MSHSTAPYSDSQFPGSSVEEEAKHSEDALFGHHKDPPVAIQKETPAHAEMIRLRVMGHTIKQIAYVTGYSPVHVGNILRQPWARHEINLLCKELKITSAMEIIERAVPAAALKLIELMDNPCSSDEIQGKNAKEILDRYLGKPKERVEHSGSLDLDKLSDKDLAALLPPTIRPDLDPVSDN